MRVFGYADFVYVVKAGGIEEALYPIYIVIAIFEMHMIIDFHSNKLIMNVELGIRN